MPESEPINTRL